MSKIIQKMNLNKLMGINNVCFNLDEITLDQAQELKELGFFIKINSKNIIVSEC